jgi:hypothetical protein
MQNMLSTVESAKGTEQLRNSFLSHLPLGPDTKPHLAGALSQTLQHPGSMVRAELAYCMARSYGLPEDRSEYLAIECST